MYYCYTFRSLSVQRLPMGVCVAPDIAQEIMEKTLADIKDIECYIDDIGIFSKDWESRMEVLVGSTSYVWQ